MNKLALIGLRIGLIAVNLVYLSIVTYYSDAASIFFVTLAMAQILGHAIPFGSNNHLANLQKIELAWLINRATLFSGSLILIAWVIDSWIIILSLTALVFYERVNFANSIANSRIDSFFLSLIIGRLACLVLIIFWNNYSLNTIFNLVMLEFIARLTLLQLPIKGIRPKLEWKNTLIAAIGTLALWWPIAMADGSTKAIDLYVARISLLLLGLGSVFYLAREALDFHRNKFTRIGLVRQPHQLILIFISVLSLIFFPIVIEYWVPIGFLPKNFLEFEISHYAALICCCLLLLISWNGAIVIVRHSLSAEKRLSLLCMIVSLIVSQVPIEVYWKVFLVGCFWHLGVILFYGRK